MKQTLRQAFKSINEINTPSHLEGAILLKIELIREKQAKKRLFLSYAGIISSFVLLFYAVASFGNAFLKSEFWSIASLVGSDISVVIGNWKDFAYSLLETFPVINIIAIFIPVFALFVSVGLFWSIKKNNHQMHLHKLSIN